MNKVRYILGELARHSIFTVASAGFGIFIFLAIEYLLNPVLLLDFELLFHSMHYLHLLFSAAATTGMFWRHERGFFRAIGIGFLGSAGVCGLSDIYLPFSLAWISGKEAEFHSCLFFHPMGTLIFIFAGIFLGFVFSQRAGVIFAHSLHVLISSFASLSYLISFGLFSWVGILHLVFIWVVLSVIIPCCLSDIVFPLIAVRRSKVESG